MTNEVSTVDDIIQTIENQHGGAFWGVFHVDKCGYKFLPTGHVLTSGAYLAVVRHFQGATSEQELTPQQRKINSVRAKAGGEYG